ncbi:hypothetical protein HanIR_Chr15g0783461 [Helianthus annuus]|nr:hypothetical protein HanIR_Chr15g0783461 [Helianthus annuus]
MISCLSHVLNLLALNYYQIILVVLQLVLTQVLEEANYKKDSTLVLSDFMKILGNSGSLKMDVEIPVD